jgi:hypothetical protein
MQDELSKLYKESKVVLQHRNKAIVSMIIANEGYRNKKIDSNKVKYAHYQKLKFMPVGEFTKFLKTIILKNSTVEYLSTIQSSYLTYKYKVISRVKTPKEFLDFIAQLNQKEIPLNVVYPLEFSKLNNFIEIKYNLQFHQQKDKNKQKNKFDINR